MFWPKFYLFFSKILCFGQNFIFWPKFKSFDQFVKISCFRDFRPKTRFLTKILTEISIIHQKFCFGGNFHFLTKILIFDQYFDFKFRFSVKVSLKKCGKIPQWRTENGKKNIRKKEKTKRN